MKLRKSIAIIICCVVMFTLPLYGCGIDTTITSLAGNSKPTVDETFAEAERINNNSNLGLAYLAPSPLAKEQDRKYSVENPGGSTTADGHVRGYYFNYPYDSDDRYMTQLVISGGNYDLFGIHVGSDTSTAAEVLEQNGYKQTKAQNESKDTLSQYFEKYDVIVSLETDIDSTVINEIHLTTNTHAPKTNLE